MLDVCDRFDGVTAFCRHTSITEYGIKITYKTDYISTYFVVKR